VTKCKPAILELSEHDITRSQVQRTVESSTPLQSKFKIKGLATLNYRLRAYVAHKAKLTFVRRRFFETSQCIEDQYILRGDRCPELLLSNCY